MSLTLCLLTRNEEANLPRVIGSVAGLADQVVVVDTGSNDRTAPVARDLGAVVHEFSWNDDFGAGRNSALEQATGDWILWLNPDEELLPAAHSVVRECMLRAEALAFGARVQELTRPDRLDSFTETSQVRLFRRLPQIQFVGRVHPRFSPPLEGLAAWLGMRLYPSEIVLRHHAYLSVLTEPKLRWSARLLALELQDYPDQLTTRIDYGKTLLRLNDPAGHQVLAEAVEQILPCRDASRPPAPQVQVLLEYLLTVSAEQSRSRLSRQEAWDLAVRWFPVSAPLLWVKASQSFRDGQFQQAAGLLEKLVELGRTGAYDQTAGFDPDIVGAGAVANLGACCIQLGDLDRAEHLFQQLLGSQVHNDVARKSLELIQSLRRSS
jgi:hypothetical protein